MKSLISAYTELTDKQKMHVKMSVHIMACMLVCVLWGVS